jgi:UDP-N-acetylglucosamine 3-dehydrogenase
MVKVAVIGYGQIGPTHIDAYKQLADVEIAAVCDLDENRAKAAQEKSGAGLCVTDYHEILKRPDIDIISVCIPTYLHAELTIKAAAAGKHVFCEKPMAMRLEDAEAMIEACERANVKLGLGFCRRFDNQWLKMAEIVHSGILGDQIIWRSYATGRGAPTPWFFNREQGGGPFVDGAVHNYDFAELMLGKVTRVSANLKTLRSGTTAKDTGTAIIDYEKGHQLTMAWSWALPAGVRGAGSQEIFGSKATLCFSNPAPDVIKVPEGTHALYVSTGPNAGQAFPYERNNMYVDELRHFVDCVKSGATPKVGGENGVNALRVALAVLEAGDTGNTITLG